MSATQPELADLVLELSQVGRSKGYQLKLRLTWRGREGELDTDFGSFKVTLREAALKQLELDPRRYGAALSRQLFAKARPEFARAKEVALNRGWELRLRLELPDTLHNLRWETLIDPEGSLVLGAEGGLRLSRYLPGRTLSTLRLPPRGDLRAVVAVAAPPEDNLYRLGTIDAAGEIKRARRALGDIATVTIGHPDDRRPTEQALSEALRDGCHILYLMAHGTFIAPPGQQTREPWLYLLNEQGLPVPTPGHWLVDQLRNLGGQRPLLVVLASCESVGQGYGEILASLGPQIAGADVPAVLAMQGKVAIDTAELFGKVFFEELRRDGLVDRAAYMARHAVIGRTDWWMPVLYTRLSSGRIWTEAAQSGAAGARGDARRPSSATAAPSSATPPANGRPPEQGERLRDLCRKLIDRLEDLNFREQTDSFTATLHRAGACAYLLYGPEGSGHDWVGSRITRELALVYQNMRQLKVSLGRVGAGQGFDALLEDLAQHIWPAPADGRPSPYTAAEVAEGLVELAHEAPLLLVVDNFERWAATPESARRLLDELWAALVARVGGGESLDRIALLLICRAEGVAWARSFCVAEPGPTWPRRPLLLPRLPETLSARELDEWLRRVRHFLPNREAVPASGQELLDLSGAAWAPEDLLTYLFYDTCGCEIDLYRG